MIFIQIMPSIVFRVSLDLEKSALANLKEEMKQAQLNQEVCVTLVNTSKVLNNDSLEWFVLVYRKQMVAERNIWTVVEKF